MAGTPKVRRSSLTSQLRGLVSTGQIVDWRTDMWIPQITPGLTHIRCWARTLPGSINSKGHRDPACSR